jgi:hypothetical protein
VSCKAVGLFFLNIYQKRKEPMKKFILVLILLLVAVSCAQYSTTRRPEAENIINAPVEVVWKKTLEILPTERMTLKEIDKDRYFITAKKHITLWSWGDEVSIRLIPKNENQTLMEFSAGTVQGFGDFGHSGRMVESIFSRIKEASETSTPYMPKKVKDAKIPTIKLRSTPKRVWRTDIEEMIGKYKFFVASKNEDGDFPNDFVDNGDGSVTDRATGLMWQKGGSSSILQYSRAQKFVSRLNKERFLGHNDWRTPTLEELCSLLESKQDEKRQYINTLFDSKQRICWTADYLESQHYVFTEYYIVDFSSGRVSKAGTHPTIQDDSFFLRAVRTTN